jgi:hypothetical protein
MLTCGWLCRPRFAFYDGSTWQSRKALTADGRIRSAGWSGDDKQLSRLLSREPVRMRSAPIVQQVRDLVARIFRELRIPADSRLEETILIRQGFYCGRRFHAESGHAIWFCEEDELKFYGEEGQVLCVVQDLSDRLRGAESPLADAA